MPFAIRRAVLADIPAIEALIVRSFRAFGPESYPPDEVESILRYGMGVDHELVADGTYFVAVPDGEGQGHPIVGAGGWSRRRKLHGPGTPGEVSPLADPATDPALVRVMFTDPDWARQGIARQILARCEAEAAREGFRRLSLAATRTGIPAYRRLGFEAVEAIAPLLSDGTPFHALRMEKEIRPPEPMFAILC